MTDPITTPAQMREAAARCCEAEADKCDDAAKWGGSKRYVSDCKAAAYAMRDRAAAIRALPVAEPERPAEGLLRGAREALAMVQAEAAPVAVRVKPLVWQMEKGRQDDCPQWIADVDAKRYEVFKAWWGDQDKWGFVAMGKFYHTEDAAKAAAEADHAASILSQIDAVSVAQVRAEALRDAEKALRDWQEDLNKQRMPDAAITMGMAADVVGALMEKPTR